MISGCLPDTETSRSDTIVVNIADRTFKVPRAYADLDKHKDVINDEVVLVYVLPGFEPEPPHPEERAKRKDLILQGRMRGMYLSATDLRPSLGTAANSKLHTWGYKKVSVDIFGLEKYEAESIEEDPNDRVDDLLIERSESGSVKSYLQCSPPGKDKVPGCSHRFADSGITYQIHWSLSELEHWRERRDEAIAFIESFEIRKTKKE
jgi:hypothetical protein